MNDECKWEIWESLGDELRLKETKLFKNCMTFDVKGNEGAKPNI